MNHSLRLFASLVCLLSSSRVLAAPSPQTRLHGVEVVHYPAAIDAVAMAYDSQRQRVVLFGGQEPQTDAPSGQTWEMVAGNLVWRSAAGPSPRSGAVLVYDEQQGVSVLFGGADHAGSRDDTWEWDGTTWTRVEDAPDGLHPAPSPFPRAAYDRSRGLVVLTDDTGATWEREGKTWVRRGADPSNPNFAGTMASLAASAPGAAADQVLLFGGLSGSSADLSLRRWQGKSWEKLPQQGPSARAHPAFASDPERGHLVLFGGSSLNGLPLPTNEIAWLWDGQTWKKGPPAPGPAPSVLVASAWEPSKQELLFWPAPFSPNLSLTSLSAFSYLGFDGAAWTERAITSLQPGGLCFAPLAFDQATGASVLLTRPPVLAEGESAPEGQTWQLDGAAEAPAWVRVAGASPPARFRASMAGLTGGGVLLYGGSTVPTTAAPPAPLGDTWLFGGGAWAKQPGEGAPPSRVDACLAALPGGGALLFGGISPTGGLLQETWRWDPAGWALVSPAPTAPPAPPSSPPPRSSCAMAFDPGSGHVILFGGRSPSGFLQDTWVWDGSSWAELAGLPGPPGLTYPDLLIDPARARLLLVSAPTALVWGGESAGWSSLSEDAMPGSSRTSRAIDARGRVVLFGGINESCTGETWLVSPVGEACASGAGCATGNCVDGVCCAQAACGECEACNLPTSPGSCAPRGVGEPDPDTCGQVCNGKGQCLADIGAACTTGASCGTGRCVDGVCCVQEECSGPCRSCAAGPIAGQCGEVREAPNPGHCAAPRFCTSQSLCQIEDSGACQGDDECDSGRCYEGRCRRPPFAGCEQDDTVARNLGTRPELDVLVRCQGARCQRGLCPSFCADTSDCLSPLRCSVAGQCVPSSLDAASSSGCSTAPIAVPSGAPGVWRIALLVAFAALARRRRAGSGALALALFFAASSAAAKPSPRLHSQVALPRQPTGGVAVATDEAHGLVYLLGGSLASATGSTDLFVWDGESMALAATTTQFPLPRYPSLGFDAPTGQLVLSGGREKEEILTSWSFDGHEWAPLAVPSTPESYRSLVWSPDQERLLLVGDLGAIFTLTPSSWEPLSGGVGPLTGAGGVTYDTKRKIVVLFGGQSAVGEGSDLLWEWDGVHWAAKAVPGGPPPLIFSAAAYDPDAQLTVFCGGVPASSSSIPDSHCHGWDGDTWTPLPDLPSAVEVALFFDPVRRHLLALGAFLPQGTSPARSLYELVDHAWQPVPSPSLEAIRRYQAGAYDPVRKKGVFFGGSDGLRRTATTWEWDGQRLRELPPQDQKKYGKSPEARLAPSLAFDPVNQGLLLFGGGNYDGTTVPADTWLLHASTDGAEVVWSKMKTTTAPAPRLVASMVTDPVRQRVLLLGGSTLDDALWIWDGASWSSKTPLVRPEPVRNQAQFAHDPGRDRFVYFGGLDPYSNTPLHDTWELDPTLDTWERKNPATTPDPLASGLLLYEESLQKLVLLGGTTNIYLDAVPPSAVAWAWDGQDWQPLEGTNPLVARSQTAGYHDPDRHRIVTFGGNAALATSRENGLVETTLLGQECGPGKGCPQGSCVDGVCCAQPSCGFCQACDLDGHQGECAIVPRGLPDPDSCGQGVCDGTSDPASVCLAFRGQPCATAADCGEGFCTDGVCCLEASCAGECSRCGGEADPPESRGRCLPVKAAAQRQGEVIVGVEDADSCAGTRACDGAGRCTKKTGQPCATSTECVGAVCAEGICRDESPPFCDGDHRLYPAGGQPRDCGAYRCTPEGTCRANCTTGVDCASGARCTANGTCVADSPQPQDEGGCALGPHPARGSRGALLLLAALARLAWPRRRLGRAARVALAALAVLGASCTEAPALLLPAGAAGVSGASGGAAGAGLAGAAGVSGAGCAGGERAASGLGPAESDAACQEYWSRYCDLERDCDPFSFGISFATVADCLATYDKLLCQPIAAAPGSPRVSAERKACVDRMASASCDDYLRFLYFNEPTTANCGDLWSGTLSEGEGCVFGAQCAGGYCYVDTEFRCGACRTAPGEGEYCSGTVPTVCAAGLTCSASESCQTPAAAGEACGAEKPCASGLFCDALCQPWLAQGESCNPNNPYGPCGLGNYCIPPSSICGPLELETQAGQPCRFLLAENRLVFCAAGLRCLRTINDAAGVCQPAPGEGEPCESFHDAGMPCAEARLQCLDGICQLPSSVDPATCL